MDATVELTLNGRTHTLSLRDGETIFAAARRSGVAPPFSCLGGYCGSCLATLEEGEVEMRVNMALSAKQIERGLVLICQAVPVTSPCRVRVAGPKKGPADPLGDGP
jgi:3-ketosteroid 9alpha-monooxygenase subunit B